MKSVRKGLRRLSLNSVGLKPAAILLLVLFLAACTAAAATDEADTPQNVEPEREINEPQDELEPTVTVSAAAPIGQPASENTPEPPEETPISREDRQTSTPMASEFPEVAPQETDDPVIGEVPQEILDMVAAELVEKTGAASDTISVIRAEEVIWPDGSMGCPQPDAVYTQAPVPGYWIVFEVDGQEYDYRASESGYFFLCDQQLPKVKPFQTGGTPES